MAKPFAYKAILTPPERMEALVAEFGPLTDPCPYPRPDGYDGLIHPWGEGPAYVNPLFWGGGLTAWVRRALKERDAGRTVVLNLPIDKWVAMLIEESSEIRYERDWYWLTPGGTKRKPTRAQVLWVLKPGARRAGKGE